MQTFESKAALKEWVVDHTPAEIVAYYEQLSGAKAKGGKAEDKFESREAAADAIWAALHPAKIKGQKAVGARQLAVAKPGAARKPQAKRKKATSARKPAKAAKRAPKAKPAEAKKGTVKADAVAMLQRVNGATIDQLMEKFGWLPHSARGFISNLGRLHGFKVESTKEGKVRRYKIAS